MTPDYRVGDTVSSGRPIVDVIDTSRIEVSAKLPEQDRVRSVLEPRVFGQATDLLQMLA